MLVLVLTAAGRASQFQARCAKSAVVARRSLLDCRFGSVHPFECIHVIPKLFGHEQVPEEMKSRKNEQHDAENCERLMRQKKRGVSDITDARVRFHLSSSSCFSAAIFFASFRCFESCAF